MTNLNLPVTRRVKGYTRFVGKYETGRTKRFRLYKVYIFLIRITSRVGLVMSVYPYEREVLGNYNNCVDLIFLPSGNIF